MTGFKDMNYEQFKEELQKALKIGISSASRDIRQNALNELLIRCVFLTKEQIKELREKIDTLSTTVSTFKQVSDKQQAKMINLTWWIRLLTFGLAALAVIQIFALVALTK
jgi:hypothetical protein